MGLELDKIEVNVKTVVVIVLWVSSVLGVYYSMKSRLDEVQAQATKLEQRIEKYNPEIIEYKVTNIEQQVSKINEKTDKIQSLLSK